MNRPETLKVILGVLGFMLAVVGAVLAMVYHARVVRRYERLRRGDGVLVRWRIGGARWRVFNDAATMLAQTAGTLPNELMVPAEIPAEGIEVVISHDAFCLGSEFELLEKNAIVRLIGPVLQIEQTVPVNRFQTRRAAYRLPAPENAEADVARLTQRFTVQATTSQDLVRKVAIVALVVVIAILIGLVLWVKSVAHR